MSFGLLPASTRLKTPLLGGFEASIGPTAAASGSLSFGNNGISGDAGLSVGLSAKASLKTGIIDASASAGCQLTSNNHDGCNRSSSVSFGKASVDQDGMLDVDVGGGPAKVNIKANPVDYLTSILGNLRAAVIQFLDTYKYVQGGGPR